MVVRFAIGLWVTVSLLLSGSARVVAVLADSLSAFRTAPASAPDSVPAARLAQVVPEGPHFQVDTNRPQTPFDCSTPRGVDFYGSTPRCLAELCAGRNVYNEYIFDENRRRKNPCYGQSPTDYPSSLE